MKAVILAGGLSNLCYPMGDFAPRPMLPFLNRPFLESQLHSLRANGFREIAVVLAPQDHGSVSAHFGTGRTLGVRIEFVADRPPRGPAGSLRAVAPFIGRDMFLVVNGTTYLGTAGLGGLVRTHVRQSASATLGMYRDAEMRHPARLENVLISAEGRIERFEILHASKDRRRARRFAGVYLFDSRVLALIPEEGYLDIKEQLVPALCERGHVVVSHPLQGDHGAIDRVESYEQLQKDLLTRGRVNRNGHVLRDQDLWVEKDTRISPSAYVLGPAVIGRGCVVEDQAQIIGPAVIGDGCRIAAGALVRESILWTGVEIGAQARVEYCTIGDECRVRSGRRLRGAVLMRDAARAEQRYDRRDDGPSARIVPVPRATARAGQWLTRRAKRFTDVLISALGLVIAAPLFLVIAVISRLDSPGPVFFVQRRCGLGGKEFRMYKFRTMVVGAEKRQRELQPLKSVDGPMFKMVDDPRVTRLGRLLRKSGLDELPQLYNVLKGDMSLVGPRPLVMEEMRWSPVWRDLRLSVKPGLTGVWQVSAQQTGFHDWIRCDLEYVKNRSFTRDCRILMQTLRWAAGSRRT